MDYIITNSSRTQFIRLNDKGSPITCNKQNAQHFDYVKAKNILDHFPKTMKKFHFKVEPIPEVKVHNDDSEDNDRGQHENDTQKSIIINESYTVPDAVTDWLNRVKSCNDLAKDAAKRKEELTQARSNIDKELSNHLHEIELEKWKSGSEGYKEYKSLKIILERRRKIKDELFVVQAILTSNLESIATNRIEKVVKRLSDRRFAVREVDDYEGL